MHLIFLSLNLVLQLLENKITFFVLDLRVIINVLKPERKSGFNIFRYRKLKVNLVNLVNLIYS